MMVGCSWWLGENGGGRRGSSVNACVVVLRREDWSILCCSHTSTSGNLAGIYNSSSGELHHACMIGQRTCPYLSRLLVTKTIL